MKIWTTTTGIFALAATVVIGCASPGTTADEADESCTGKCDSAANPAVDMAIDQLESFIESSMTTDQIPGMAIGIVKDQKLIYARGFGVANQETNAPFTPDSRQRIASITKTFMAIAAHKLAEEGFLDLNAPIGDTLGAFEMQDPKAYSPAARITPIHIMSHTAGVSRDVGVHQWEGFHSTFPTTEQIWDALPNQESISAPGSRLKYSNLGYFLLGQVLETVTFADVDDIVSYLVLGPLGMWKSGFVRYSDHGMVVGYGRTRDADGKRLPQPIIHDPAGSSAYAGLYSTVRDLAKLIKWMNRVDDTGEILSPASFEHMVELQKASPDLKEGMGLGIWWYQLAPTSLGYVIGHFGSFTGHRSAMFVNPRTKVGVIVFLNAWEVSPAKFISKAFETVGVAVGGTDTIATIDASKAPAALPAPDFGVAKPDWSKYVGSYMTERRLETIALDAEGYLTFTHGGGKRLIQTDDPTVFRLVEDGFWQDSVGERLQFDLDADGKVVSLTVGRSVTFRRLP